MKIYTYIRMDISTGETLEERSFEYDGNVALCKGGGNSGGGVDAAYNSRMATISEKELAMATRYYEFWRDEYRPMEKAQIEANMKMLPSMTDAQIWENKYNSEVHSSALAKDKDGRTLVDTQQAFERNQLKASMELLPWQTEAGEQGLRTSIERSKRERELLPWETESAEQGYRASIAQSKQSMDLIPQQTKVATAAYKAALAGIDENAAGNQARTDVNLSYGNAQTSLRRDLSRVGMSSNTDQYVSAMAGLSRGRMKDAAGAMTTARQSAKDEEFKRLYGLTTANVGRV